MRLHRLPVTVGLALVSLSSPVERIASVHRQGDVLTQWMVESTSIVPNEVTATLNGTKVPLDSFEEMELPGLSARESTRTRVTDRILEVEDGRPTRLRRTFEELRTRKEEDGEETEEIGVLEGETLVLSAEDGRVAVQIEGGKVVEARDLAGHRLTNPVVVLLPDGEVEPGDSWPIPEDALLNLLGSGRTQGFFQDETDDPVSPERIGEHGSMAGEVRFVAVEERDGLSCAALTFEMAVRSDTEAIETDGLRIDREISGRLSGSAEVELTAAGRLWFALAERRPVALEQSVEGVMHLTIRAGAGAMDIETVIHVTALIEGETKILWRAP